MKAPRSVITRVVVVLGVALTIGSSPATAQSRGVQAGGAVSVLRLSEFDITRVGAGAQVVWPLTPVVAIDGALSWFPGAQDFQTDRLETQSLVVGLAGLRFAARYRNVELFPRARAGFLRFGAAEPIVCIAIFPVPLGCRLAAGYNAFAAEVGAGASVRLLSSGRLRLHIEGGDLLVRYGFEAYRPGAEVTRGFVSHNLLVSAGLNWQF